MTTKVVTASPSMTINEAATLLADNQIMGVPVVNAAGFLVGVISQTDIIRHDREKGAPAAGETRVKDIMTPLVISANRDDDVFDLARMMIDQRIHRIVIAEENKLYGIVTTTDLLKAFLTMPSGGNRKPPVKPRRRHAVSRRSVLRHKSTVRSR